MSSEGAPLARADPLGTVEPVISRSATAQVADQIVLAVREHRLHPGDRLPSERELASRFGVSRPTIREALAALELAGIVESHKGRGTAVIGTSSHVAMWGVEVLPPQVFEARLAVEPELARLAAEKRYPEDLVYLHRALDDLEREFESTGTYQSDLPIHRAIARAARNPILERALDDALVHTQSQLWTAFRERAFGTAQAATQAATRHLGEVRQVVKYVEQGKAAGAADVWRQHLLFFRDEMLGRTPAVAAGDSSATNGQS
jgi:GntR family transcriptional regulator, transcriptional repressor for pyruvate dehydrogenase complex